MGTSTGMHIAILGAGFGGVGVARELVRQFPRREDCTITLVDQNNFFLFTPMLTEVAAGELDTRHIVNPIRQISPRITFEKARVDGIDLDARQIVLTLDGPDGKASRKLLEADHIVLALGSVANFHHLPGVAEHSLTMKNLGDAITLRNRVLGLLERADAEPESEQRRELLTFVVSGGGFSGVETMAALNDSVRASLRYYPHVRAEEVRMLLVEPSERLLSELSASLAHYAAKKLQGRGVEIMLNTKVASAGADHVLLGDESRINMRTLIWTGGVTPSPVIGALDCKKGKHGGVVVDAHCAVSDRSGIWALGDCAAVPRGEGKTYGPTAQNATREGRCVARNIAATMRGQPLRPFTYTPIGELAIVGRHTGVAQVFGLRFSGLPAWAMWRGVYLAKLPRLTKKVRVGIDWGLDMVFGRDISALPVTRSTAPQTGG